MSVRRVQASWSSFADAYQHHGNWLRRRLVRIHGASVGEDLAQEVWARLVASTAPISPRSPRAVLATIARNLAVDELRKRARHPSEALFGELAGPGASLQQAEAVLHLKQVIAAMAPSLREVFVLSRFTGLTNAEIAERLGISVKTVEWRMTKALAHCAAELRK
ncbi:RNA polymerase sigma factor [Brevundimonas bacteroides]|uniref:RNA polymerase sigma factor n=1 Tax=Brevundimonas bacteroides TaxID=74311 RepID=UPI000A03AC9D|nr:RNA polymerase sigma factor [Brevundimonas bacteroides]